MKFLKCVACYTGKGNTTRKTKYMVSKIIHNQLYNSCQLMKQKTRNASGAGSKNQFGISHQTNELRGLLIALTHISLMITFTGNATRGSYNGGVPTHLLISCTSKRKRVIYSFISSEEGKKTWRYNTPHRTSKTGPEKASVMSYWWCTPG